MLKQICNGKNFGRAMDVTKQIRSTLEQRVFNFKCEKQWSELLKTDNSNVHFCTECFRNVFKVMNEKELLKRAEIGQCVFYSHEIMEHKLRKSCSVNIDESYEFMGDPYTMEELERHNTDESLPFSENQKLIDDNELF